MMAVKEYKEGTFFQELATTEGEIKLAESDLSRAVDRVDWTRRMFERANLSGGKGPEELKLKMARFALEHAQSKKKVLVDHSKDKTIKALMGAVETARGASWPNRRGSNANGRPRSG